MSGFNFGSTQTAPGQTNIGFNFGTKTTTGTTGFGSTLTTTTQSSSAFGAGTTFGNPSGSTFGSFGTSFNPTTTTTTTNFSSSFFNKPLGFGSTTGTSLFQTPGQQLGQPQQQQQQQQQQNPQIPLGCLFTPKIYNDERDNIIGLFNSIQSFWGTGKAYYSAFNPPYELTESDTFNRFKTICYSEIISEEKDKEEKILLLIKYTTDESQLKTNILTYEQNFKQIIGNNYAVKFELKSLLPDGKALISIVVTENSTMKQIPDAQLRAYFNQPQWKQQLNQVFGGNFIDAIFSTLSKQEIDAYLCTPPKGIDERIWEQAKLENPDLNRFIPLPLIGFDALNNRFKLQEKEINSQQMRLKQMLDNVAALESNISQFKAKFEECRRKHDNLSYQVLKKMIAQEVQRKRTLPIQAEEDKLRANLEVIQSELNVPTKFQGCLNELMSQLRQMQCQNQQISKISFDKNIMNEYQQFLKEENKGIVNLVEILKKDIQDINQLSKK